MGYPWECSDCVWLNTNDEKDNKFWCPKYRKYFRADERSCNSHFEKKTASSSSCYLTTAMCDILGQEDNCYILETLRAFRDNIMKPNKEYIPLLEEYNLIGPQICEKIYNDEQKTIIAKCMLYLRIEPAIKAINNKEYEKAIEIYKDMTQILKEQFLTEEKPKQRTRINE